jgi:hypothetical protein
LDAGQRAFCDAAGKNEENMNSSLVGIGVSIPLEDNGHYHQQVNLTPGSSVKDLRAITGSVIYCDAAWVGGTDSLPMQAGIGVFLQIEGSRSCRQLFISAISPPASSAIQAEAFGMLFAVRLAETLQIQGASILTDNATLAAAAASQDILDAPGHWMIRPQLAAIISSNWFHARKVFHVSRSLNFKAHHQAKLALKLLNRPLFFRCVEEGNASCLNRKVSVASSVSQFTLVSVKCC